MPHSALCLAFSFDARNSGLSTNLRIAFIVGGPSLDSRTIGKDAAFSISLSPSRRMARALRSLFFRQFQPSRDWRPGVCHEKGVIRPCEGERPLDLKLDLVHAFALLGRE